MSERTDTSAPALDALELVRQAIQRPEDEGLLDQIRSRAEEIVGRLEETDATEEFFETSDPLATGMVLEALAEGLGYEADWEEKLDQPSPFFIEAEKEDERLGRALAELLDGMLGPAKKRLEDLRALPELGNALWQRLCDEPDVKAMLDASGGRLKWLVQRGLTPRVFLHATNALGLIAWRAQERRILPPDEALLLSSDRGLSATGARVSADQLVEEISETAVVPRDTAQALFKCICELLTEAPEMVWDYRAVLRDGELALVRNPRRGDAPIEERWLHQPLMAAPEPELIEIPDPPPRVRQRVPAPINPIRRLPDRAGQWTEAVAARSAQWKFAAVAASVIAAAALGILMLGPNKRIVFIGTAAPIPRNGEIRLASLDHSDQAFVVPVGRAVLDVAENMQLMLVGQIEPSPRPELRRVEFQLTGGGFRSEPVQVPASQIPEQAVRFLAAVREASDHGSQGQVISKAALEKVSTRGLEAQRHYAEGVDALYHFDALEATRALDSAVKEDPSNPFAHLALSEAREELGYEKLAAQAARDAQLASRASGLSGEEQDLIEARWRAAEKEWDLAIDKYKQLHAQSPTNLQYVLGAASALTSSGRAREALQLLENTQESVSQAKDDPRLYLAEARAAKELAEWGHQREAAQDAAKSAGRAGADLLVARALLLEGEADLVLEQNRGKALTAFDDAKAIFEKYGDTFGVAEVFKQMAVVAGRLERNEEDAREQLKRALAKYKEIGSESGEADVKVLLGHTYAERQPAEARRLYEKALDVYKSLGNQRGESKALTSLGILEWEGKDLEKARKHLEQALEISRRIEDKEGQAYALGNLGGVFDDQKEPRKAEKSLKDALEIRRQIGNESAMAASYRMLGEFYLDQRRFSKARSNLELAFEIQSKRNEKTQEETQRLLTRAGDEERRLAVKGSQ
jgi:tetratricopeptide (TPR) repeat protein